MHRLLKTTVQLTRLPFQNIQLYSICKHKTIQEVLGKLNQHLNVRISQPIIGPWTLVYTIHESLQDNNQN